MAKAWSFLRLTRPVFLIGGIVLQCLGAAIAVYEGAQLSWLHLITGQLLVTATQMMTHYTNEYFDQPGDRINRRRTWFSGGSGILTDGKLLPVVARRAMAVMASLALAALLLDGLLAPVVVLPGTISIFISWSYSAPPLRLSETGLGEAAASLIVALGAPVVGFGMQAGQIGSPLLWWVCAPLVLVHFAMLIAFQIPDEEADAASGKRTLTVRLGYRTAGWIHNAALAAAFGMVLWLALRGAPGAWAALLALPLAVFQAVQVWRIIADVRPWRYPWLTTAAIALMGLASALWLAGMVLAV